MNSDSKQPENPLSTIHAKAGARDKSRMVCLQCYTAFTPVGPIRRTFLGFRDIWCLSCRQESRYPMSEGYWKGYVVFIFGVVVLCAVIMANGANFACPGLLWFAGVFALIQNRVLIGRVEDAWKRHKEIGQPEYVHTNPSALAETDDERDQIRWYHVVFCLVVPYVAILWGIVNLIRKKRRSGLLLIGLSVG